MSLDRFVVAVALAGGLIATLQGCGGGGAGTTPSPGPAPWNFTKDGPKCKFDDPSGRSCTQAADGNEMAKYLTDNYVAFDPKNIKAGDPLGVYITMQDARLDASGKLVGDLHHYCKTYGTQSCYKGYADCILSVALYNRHVMLDGDGDTAPAGAGYVTTFAGRCAGYVLNTSKAESRYNKCAYIFNGDESQKLYFGCGNAAVAAGPTACDKEHIQESAFSNICPSTGKECQHNDIEVRPRNDCTKIKDGEFKRPWPVRTDDTPCYFTGPAFAYPDMSQAKDWNKITEMVSYRIGDQNPIPGLCNDTLDQCPGYPPQGKGGYCCMSGRFKGERCHPGSWNCNRLRKWNTIVMDLRPLVDDLRQDPNGVIVAFVYAGHGCLPQAKALRAKFKETYGGPGDAPLIYLDQTVNVIPTLKKSDTPFKYIENPTREQVGALTWEESDEFERWMMTGRDEPSVSV